MYIRILFENNYKTRWLGMGENYTIESLKNLIKTFSKVCGFDGVAYQLEYKSIQKGEKRIMTEKNTILKLNGGFKEITTKKQKLIEKAKKSLENRIKSNKITLFEIKSIIASINDIIKYDYSYTSINDTQSFFKNNGFKVIEKDTFYIIEI